jgi:Xaa-Pro aminopeptidase
MASLERIKIIQKAIKNEALDAFIVNGNANNYYLTGVVDNVIKNTFYLVILKNNFYFIGTNFHLKQIRKKIPQRNIRLADKSAGFGKIIVDILKNSEKIGFESQQFSYAKYENFKKLLAGKKFMPFADIVEQTRGIKSAGEIALIKKAAAITDKTFAELLKLIKPGVSEICLKQKTIEIMNGFGATGTAFDPIVASGKNSADPHYEGSNKKIKAGEMVVIDIGARYKNYNADMTRMVFVGKATEKYKKMYQIVLETQQLALADCKIGASPKLAFDNCVENFKKYGEDQYFTHGLGHGVGIDIHELPNLSPAGIGKFDNGMVFTVEPGLYHPGWGGIRIEDLCRMKNGKAEILSRTPKNLIEI